MAMLRESDDDYRLYSHKHSNDDDELMTSKEIDSQLEKIKSMKSKAGGKMRSSSATYNLNEKEKSTNNKTKSPNIMKNKMYSGKISAQFQIPPVDYTQLDSTKLREPIIKRDNFAKNISKEVGRNEKIELKLMEYPILKDIIDKCGSYPEKTRSYVWKFLLSLPGNKILFDKYSAKGIHPFYKNLEQTFPVKDRRHLRKLQQILSVISFWSPHLGNVYFLPNLIFPFVKSVKGDDVFLFEVILSFINCFCQCWFEFYPGAPLNHIKLGEKIIEKEAPMLVNHLYNLNVQEEEGNYLQNNPQQVSELTLSDLFWRMMKNNFSECLIKEAWLQYMDFIITHNHKPEIVLYFACSLLIKKEALLLKSNNLQEFENLLFNSKSNMNIQSLFTLALKLFNNYSKYQIYKYKPHLPCNGDTDSSYPVIDKFPLDFLETTAKLREDLFREEENFNKKTEEIDEIEKRFKELLKKEEMIQKSYECLIHKEKEKGQIMKRELDLILYQKSKYYDEIKSKKLDKVDKLSKIIEGSIQLYDKMHKNELERFEEELRKRKMIEEMDLKQRLQQEELNNLEFEANRKMLEMLNLRNKDEEERRYKAEEDLKTKDREVMKRLLEEKWKLEDEEMLKKLENLRNLKEFELLKKKEGNDLLYKEYSQKLNEFEQNLMLQQVERERRQRLLHHEFEVGKVLIENQVKKRNDLLTNEEKNEFNKFTVRELDLMKERKKEQNEILVNKLRENLKLLDEEEKALMDYEQMLKKREFEIKLNEIQKKGELHALEDEKYFQDQYLKLEEQKRLHLIKKEEMELKRQNMLMNLNQLANMKNNQYEIIQEQRNNFEKFKSIYEDETMNKINKLRGEGESNYDKNQAYDSNNFNYTSNPNTKSYNSPIYSNPGSNLRQINEGIRNLSSYNNSNNNFYTSKYSKNNYNPMSSDENGDYNYNARFSSGNNYNYTLDDNKSQRNERSDSKEEVNYLFKLGEEKYQYHPQKTTESNQYSNNYNNYSNTMTSGNKMMNSGNMTNYKDLSNYGSPVNRNIQSLGSLSLSQSNR